MALTLKAAQISSENGSTELAAKIHALSELLEVSEKAFLDEATHLEIANSRLSALNEQLTAEIRERKQAEEAARSSERHLATTLKSIGDAVIATDTNGRVTLMNPVAEKLTGWTMKEAANRPLADVFHIVSETNLKAVENPVTTVLREGVVVSLANHTLLIARDGSEYPIADSGAPIRETETGPVQGVVLVFRDQSDERNAQQKIAESEEKFRTMLENSADWVWEIDAQNRYIYASSRIREMLGYEPQEILGRKLFDLMAPKEPQQARDIAGALIKAHKEIKALETINLHKSGYLVAMETNARPFFDKKHKLLGYRGIDRDITERRKNLEEARRNYDTQNVVYNMLHLSLTNISIDKIFKKTFDMIFAIPWLALESKGCIFLVENEADVLTMKYQRGLADDVQSACARLPFGRCLCGKAAQSHRMVFCNQPDEKHEIKCDSKTAHGHYCLPLIAHDQVVGTFALQVKDGQHLDKKIAAFLSTIAEVLAGVILHKHLEAITDGSSHHRE